MRRTNPGMAKTFAKELIRNGAGIAMNRDNAKMPKRIHHFSHHSGNSTVMTTEMPASKTYHEELLSESLADYLKDSALEPSSSAYAASGNCPDC